MSERLYRRMTRYAAFAGLHGLVLMAWLVAGSATYGFVVLVAAVSFVLA